MAKKTTEEVKLGVITYRDVKELNDTLIRMKNENTAGSNTKFKIANIGNRQLIAKYVSEIEDAQELAPWYEEYTKELGQLQKKYAIKSEVNGEPALFKREGGKEVEIMSYENGSYVKYSDPEAYLKEKNELSAKYPGVETYDVDYKKLNEELMKKEIPDFPSLNMVDGKVDPSINESIMDTLFKFNILSKENF